MKLIFKQITLVAIIALIYSSCGERRPYVLANTVMIEYRDTVYVDEWIEIDGVRFTHVSNFDDLKDDSINSNLIYEQNLLPATNQDVSVDGSGDRKLAGITPTSGVATSLFEALSLSDLNDLGQFYGFKGHILELSSGKFTFYRKDGEKIKVTTSDGYTGIVRKVD